jgi:hypothetical protein
MQIKLMIQWIVILIMMSLDEVYTYNKRYENLLVLTNRFKYNLTLLKNF